MDFVRGIIQVGPVWLTALMTLVASAPQLYCRCPDGSLKLFCHGAPSTATGCCCGGSCASGGCPTHRTPQAGTPGQRSGCCGQSHVQPTAKAPGQRCQAAGAGCQMTLVPAVAVIITPTKKALADDLTARLFVPTPETPLALRVSACGNCRITWQNYRLPPPTDLVIAHQHFLI